MALLILIVLLIGLFATAIFLPQLKEIIQNWDRTTTLFAWIIVIVILALILARNV